MTELYAKSGQWALGVGLVGHTWAVVQATELLARERLPLAREALRHPLPDAEKIAVLAAFLHDLGKANDAFQARVCAPDRAHRAQPIRHEALSVEIATHELWPWLTAAYAPEMVYAAIVAAAGHHRKYPHRAVAPDDTAEDSCLLLLGHPSFEKLLRLGHRYLGLPSTSELTLVDRRVTRAEVQRNIDQLDDQLTFSAADPLLATLKALVIAGDVLGSAEPQRETHRQFVTASFANRLAPGDYVRLASRGQVFQPYPFQRQVAASDAPVTLLTAGCGTGKTAAAYLWAQQHGGRQLWYCYPTTGTATEGFRDYLRDPQVESRLEHCRREVDINLLWTPGEDQAHEVGEVVDRIESLEIWGAQVVCCTVDTVLGLLQCQRKGMYAWPALIDGAFVFDEIHAYDPVLFGGLLRFLETFPGLPVLLMTATLPPARLAELDAVVQRIHGDPMARVGGPLAEESKRRYVRSEQDPRALLERRLASGDKVLWVHNTVRRCQDAFEQSWPVRPICYHSRFRYLDRVRQHRAVMDAFQEPGGCLILATQVCEMSLDISADILVTELAPIWALIQRLGRLNRAGQHQGSKPFLIVEPDHPLPYTAAELNLARRWLFDPRLQAASSQRDLICAWEQLGRFQEAEPVRESSWLDGGLRTEPGVTRRTTPGLTVLLESDANDVLQGAVPVAAVCLPMSLPPAELEWAQWPRVRGIPVAPDGVISYDLQRGGRWL